MTRLLITGVSGLLGVTLGLIAAEVHREDEPYQVTGITHAHKLRNTPFEVAALDLNDFKGVSEFLDRNRPEQVIHCAAIANIDEAEKNPEAAWHLNKELPSFLAAECARRGIRLLHISTDAVFDGSRGNYSEEDSVHPLSVYARSKAEAEQAVLANDPKALIARVNFYGWSLSGQRSLAEWFFSNLQACKTINGFTDVCFCPLLVNQLAEILLELVASPFTGLFHVVSRESLSKYDFGVAIARLFGFDETLIRPIASADAGLLARRSPNLTLSTDKLSHALKHPLPDVHSGLLEFKALYQAGYPQKIRSMSEC